MNVSVNVNVDETVAQAAERWRRRAAETHNGLHYSDEPALWRYFQLVRQHALLRDQSAADLLAETVEGDVLKAVPLFTLPLLLQSRRLVELGTSFTLYPEGYATPWQREPAMDYGVVSTRLLLAACRLLRDIAGIDATLTSVELRDGRRVEPDGSVSSMQDRCEQLMADLGLKDLWWPHFGVDSATWLAQEGARMRRRATLPVDFLLVDSNHTYEVVKAELEGAQPLMSARGVILVDDSYSTNYRHGQTWTPEESEYGIRHGGEFGAVVEFAERFGWRIEWLQYMALLRR